MKLSFYVWIVFLFCCAVALTEAIALIVHGIQQMQNRHASWSR